MTELGRKNARPETEFRKGVVRLARLNGWLVSYAPTVQRRKDERWVTTEDYDAGRPDLTLARNGVVLLIELKVRPNKPTEKQKAWLAAAGTHGRCFYPEDWPTIHEVLR